jgi:hypothetical protein
MGIGWGIAMDGKIPRTIWMMNIIAVKETPEVDTCN